MVWELLGKIQWPASPEALWFSLSLVIPEDERSGWLKLRRLSMIHAENKGGGEEREVLVQALSVLT